jgi:predicted peptidase
MKVNVEIIMRCVSGVLIIMVLLATISCQKPEDVLPAPAKGKITAVTLDDDLLTNDSATNIDSVVIDSTKVDSAYYQYGKFKQTPYRVMIPKNYDSSKTYPILVFLHGIGERGKDNQKQLTWGASLFQADSIRNKYPAFIVFPQCPESHYWFDQRQTENLKGLIDSIVKRYSIDTRRIYIGGLSMGAYGTYAMVAKNPALFAAAIAISGDGDPGKAPVMKKPRWRIFAGKKDNVVSSSNSVKMAEALRKSGASVSLTLYPDADHMGSWTTAFAEPDFCSWLFAHDDPAVRP